MRSAFAVFTCVGILSACGAAPRQPRPTTSAAAPICSLDLGRKHARRIGHGERSLCAAACGLGDRGACVTYSIALEGGRGGPKDLVEATRIARDLCAQDYGPGCTQLATLGEGAVDRALVERACSLGDPAGCIHLAFMYEEGEGVPQDVARGAALHDKACAMGEPIACVNAAWLYDLDGPIEPKNPARAVAVYAKACDEGAAVGCNNLAHHLFLGTVLPRDPKRGLELYERACADDYMLACVNLATVFSEGEDVPRDLARARELWQLACDEGREDACEELRD